MKLLDEELDCKERDCKPADKLDAQQLEQLGEILDELLVAAEAGHAPDVESACQRHPELASAIRHYVRSMQMLHNAVHAKPASSSDGSRINLLAPPERQLGDYRLVREIGRGGMGIVYEAEQLSLARRVALKILPFAAVLDGRQITRFQNEAQAAASLHHPHIVPVYAVGHERGTYYYSMQYIDGQTLEFAIDQMRQGRDGSLLGLHSEDQAHLQLRNASTIVARGSRFSPPVPRPQPQSTLPSPSATSARAPAIVKGSASTVRMNADASTVHSVRNSDYIRRVAEIGVQAAEALHYAHQHGIIHRDVKPSNLMLAADGNLWVTDFGLAQCATSNNLTRSGDVVGTLRYMSPEQAAGRSHLIDHRTDVYALGATLYELLTLRAVVDSSDRMAMARQIENESPRSLRKFNSAIPVDVENIVLKAIAKSREERYASADELAADLKRFLDGKTPLARRPTLLDHSARWIRRHAKGVAISALIATFMLFGAITTAVLLQTKNREIEIANAQAENHLLRANEAVYQFSHSFMHRLELLPGSEEIRRDTARDTLAYFRAFAAYAHSRSLMRLDVPRALMICGDIELQLGEPAAAVDHYRQANSLWAQIDTPDRPAHQLLCQNNLGTAFAQLGKLEEAKQVLQSAIGRSAHLRPSLNPLTFASADHVDVQPTLALLHLNLGHVLWELHQNRHAQAEFASALDLLDRWQSTPYNTMQLAQLDRQQKRLSELTAAALVQSGQLVEDSDQARALFEQAVSINQQRTQANPDDMAAVHDLSLARLALGANLMTDDDIDPARRLFHKAVNDMKRLHQQHPAIVQFGVDLASALNNLGQAELEAHAVSAAEQNFLQSKSLLERLYLGSQDYMVASNLGGVCNNLAVTKEHQGQLREAELLLNQAIKYQELALSKSPDSARCRDFLAEHRAQLARLTTQQP